VFEENGSKRSWIKENQVSIEMFSEEEIVGEKSQSVSGARYQTKAGAELAMNFEI
jgi:hypothetical protein